jgi:hypothetical protein
MQFKLHQRKSDKGNTLLYKKAIEFFVDALLSKTKQNKLKIKIIIKNFKKNPNKELGNCAQVNRYNYIIEINKNQSFPSVISTLAHEISHVRQGVMGKLVMTTIGFVWNGKLFKSVDIDNASVYNDSAWEKEAFSNEVKLTKIFFKTILIQEMG